MSITRDYAVFQEKIINAPGQKLILAIKDGDLTEMLRLLDQEKVDPDSVGYLNEHYCCTPLITAINLNRIDMIAALLERGAKCDNPGVKIADGWYHGFRHALEVAFYMPGVDRKIIKALLDVTPQPSLLFADDWKFFIIDLLNNPAEKDEDDHTWILFHEAMIRNDRKLMQHVIDIPVHKIMPQVKCSDESINKYLADRQLKTAEVIPLLNAIDYLAQISFISPAVGVAMKAVVEARFQENENIPAIERGLIKTLIIQHAELHMLRQERKELNEQLDVMKQCVDVLKGKMARNNAEPERTSVRMFK